MKQKEAIRQLWQFAWWVEIVTEEPYCRYYFGPFADGEEADKAQAGYIEDLEQEGALGIHARIKWCQPKEITICEEELAESSKGMKVDKFALNKEFTPATLLSEKPLYCRTIEIVL